MTQPLCKYCGDRPSIFGEFCSFACRNRYEGEQELRDAKDEVVNKAITIVRGVVSRAIENEDPDFPSVGDEIVEKLNELRENKE